MKNIIQYWYRKVFSCGNTEVELSYFDNRELYDILTDEQICNIIIHYMKRREYVDYVIRGLDIAYPPSEEYDKIQPEYWKPEYWKWFLLKLYENDKEY